MSLSSLGLKYGARNIIMKIRLRGAGSSTPQSYFNVNKRFPFHFCHWSPFKIINQPLLCHKPSFSCKISSYQKNYRVMSLLSLGAFCSVSLTFLTPAHVVYKTKKYKIQWVSHFRGEVRVVVWLTVEAVSGWVVSWGQGDGGQRLSPLEGERAH